MPGRNCDHAGQLKIFLAILVFIALLLRLRTSVKPHSDPFKHMPQQRARGPRVGQPLRAVPSPNDQPAVCLWIGDHSIFVGHVFVSLDAR